MVADRPVPDDTADSRLVGVYLNDHLAGSVAGSHRYQRLARTLDRTVVGPEVARVAQEVTQEREELRALIETLRLSPQNRVKQVAAWAGEHVARLKASPGALRRSGMRTLLEVEVLRSALVGKLGVWQTLADLAGPLDLDAAHMAGRAERTLQQVRTMDEVHAYVRRRVLSRTAQDR